MLPKLYEHVKPVPTKTRDSISTLVRFARDEIPADVWLEEFGDAAPLHVVQRCKHHYHLHLHEYKSLSHHVHNVVTWENEFPIVYWPTPLGMQVLVFLVVVVLTLLARCSGLSVY